MGDDDDDDDDANLYKNCVFWDGLLNNQPHREPSFLVRISFQQPATSVGYWMVNAC